MRGHATTVDGKMYTKYRLWLKIQQADAEKESVFAPFSLYSGSLLVGRSARKTHDRSEQYAQSNLWDTRVLFLVTFYILLSTLPTRKLHALSLPPVARHALDIIIYMEERYILEDSIMT